MKSEFLFIAKTKAALQKNNLFVFFVSISITFVEALFKKMTSDEVRDQAISIGFCDWILISKWLLHLKYCDKKFCFLIKLFLIRIRANSELHTTDFSLWVRTSYVILKSHFENEEVKIKTKVLMRYFFSFGLHSAIVCP